MSKLQIIGFPQSNFVWATRIACAEKGVAHDVVPVMPHTPDVDAIHPFGKIPAMRHGEVTLCESRAICAYVDRVFPGPALVPDDPILAAEVEQWVWLVATSMDPIVVREYLFAYLFPGTADGSPDRARIDAILPKVNQAMAVFSTAVETGYLVGGAFTLADAYLIPNLYYLNRLPETAAMIAASPSLAAYLAGHMDRPSVRDTVPPPLPKQA